MKVVFQSSSTLSVLFLSIGAFAVQATVCDVIDQGTTFDPSKGACDIFVMDHSFSPMITGNESDMAAKLKLRLERDKKLFHEGPVLFDDALYFVSNRLGPDGDAKPAWGKVSSPKLDQFIEVWKLDLESNELQKQDVDKKFMANGMTKTSDGKNILMLSQGYCNKGGGIFEFNRETHDLKPVLTSFFGRDLNSPNDIEITNDGIIFFSDPPYGFEQGFRSFTSPALGSNVYRYDTKTKIQTLLTASLVRPNGVALLDDRQNGNGCYLFLSDTGFETAPFLAEEIQSARGLDGFGDSTIYMLKDYGKSCFSPKDGPWAQQPFIPTTKGIQDGMEVHSPSQLLFYCDGNGVWIRSIPMYQVIGLIKVPGGCTQVMFPQKLGVQTVFILAETKLYEISLDFQATNSTCPEPT